MNTAQHSLFDALEPAVPRDLILASAGSGKTFRISSDIIALLARDEAPDEIFASTFTRKAAGEILDRVLIRLAKAALDAGEARELAVHARVDAVTCTPEFWRTVLDRSVRRLHRMNIGTLDSFFLRTVTSFSAELGMPTVWRIADQPTAKRLRSLALQDVLNRTDRTVLIELIRGMMPRAATRSLHEALLRKVDTLVKVHYALDPTIDGHWSAFDALAANSDPATLEAERLRLAALFAQQEAPLTKSGTPRRHWVNALAEIAAALQAGDWRTFMASKLVERARTGDVYDSHAVPLDLERVIDQAIAVARAEVALILKRRSHALGDFARRYTAALERRRAELGAYEFDDITRVLGGPDPLGSREDMYYRLDARAKHLLFDEFQDTSIPQWEALHPLADELLSGHLGERAGVIVADPKQSIYGWRGGTPDLVRQIGESYALGRGELTKSWRSSRVVLDFVNDLYTRIGDDGAWGDGSQQKLDERHAIVARDWLREFTPHTPAKELAGHVLVKVGPHDEGSGEARPRLSAYAARHVAQLHARMPDFTIGVLTRTNAAVARMMLNLKAEGVHASEEGGNPLTDAASVTAVLALLRMCDNPGNMIARYHVANTPLGAAIGYTDHRDEAATLALSAEWRRRLLEDGYGATITDLAKKIDHACDAREQRRLTQLIELAFRFEDGATLRPSDFVHFVRNERVEDPVAANVRVMTVHQAKGLEFDIVVLPELDAPLVRATYQEIIAYRPHPGARVTRAFPYVHIGLRSLFSDLPELQEAHDQLFRNELRDGLSILYVALTRARHALHVIVKPNQGRGRSGARVILRTLAPGHTTFEEGAVVIERGDPQWYETERRRRAQETAAHQEQTQDGDAPTDAHPRITLRAPGVRRRALPRRSPSQLEGHGRVDLRMLLRLSDAVSRGSVVHRWFEEIGWLEDGVPGDEELLALAREVASGLTDEDATALLRSFRQWLALPKLARLLQRSGWPAGSEVAHEVPFLAREGDTIVEGYIDRLVLTRTEGRVTSAALIDFKTDAVSSRTEVEERRTHYKPQVDAYRRAVCRMYGLELVDVQAWLVFLEAGAVVEVPWKSDEA
ncbi:MAG: UvrD-helicase domain-containing protein [Candidatus Cloacimonetes bacterium]|nr:UvrD-helicase domain-containing protein [Candidatus Cloacimonadota bacterium]